MDASFFGDKEQGGSFELKQSLSLILSCDKRFLFCAMLVFFGLDEVGSLGEPGLFGGGGGEGDYPLLYYEISFSWC